MSGGFLLLGLFFVFFGEKTNEPCIFSLNFLRGRSSPRREGFMIVSASFGYLLEGHDVMSLIWGVVGKIGVGVSVE